ncbi:hypothetical protein [Bradyrhizobium neotropicale]|nr:hypothetical protein [Bradyrhizobium neotropicale]
MAGLDILAMEIGAGWRLFLEGGLALHSQTDALIASVSGSM